MNLTGLTFSPHPCCCRTGTGAGGQAGISVLLIARDMEGVETRPIKTSYSASAGTALISFEGVKVPVRNLIGKHDQGFLCVMYNFNHERWMIIALMTSLTRASILC
jgi:alkylation response protein AidB-like acyl-CoA dehydrogenase